MQRKHCIKALPKCTQPQVGVRPDRHQYVRLNGGKGQELRHALTVSMVVLCALVQFQQTLTGLQIILIYSKDCLEAGSCFGTLYPESQPASVVTPGRSMQTRPPLGALDKVAPSEILQSKTNDPMECTRCTYLPESNARLAVHQQQVRVCGVNYKRVFAGVLRAVEVLRIKKSLRGLHCIFRLILDAT